MLFIVLLFSVSCTSTGKNSNTKGVLINGKPSHDLIFEPLELTDELQPELIGVWYTNALSTIYSFYRDGPFVRIINNENNGSLIEAGT